MIYEKPCKGEFFLTLIQKIWDRRNLKMEEEKSFNEKII